MLDLAGYGFHAYNNVSILWCARQSHNSAVKLSLNQINISLVTLVATSSDVCVNPEAIVVIEDLIGHNRDEACLKVIIKDCLEKLLRLLDRDWETSKVTREMLI